MVASQEQQKDRSTKIFQAIGLIYGKVTVGDNQSSVDLDGEKFKLICPRRIRNKLINCLKNNLNPSLYLKVYPQFNVFTHEYSFSLVKFYLEQPKQTQVNQFLLAGIWQYVPFLPDTPVISIYRNILRSWESQSNFRNNHFPIDGFNEIAFSYEEKNPEKVTARKFYEIVACFNPKQKSWKFLFLLDNSEEIPHYLKKIPQKEKKSSRKSAPEFASMNFITLQKSAAKLREYGFLEGNIAGKGVTKEFLTTKIQDVLSTRPEAVKILNF